MGVVTTNGMGVDERLMAGRMRAASVETGMEDAGVVFEDARGASRRSPAAV